MPRVVEGRSETLRFDVAKPLADYLSLLARTSILGVTANDVARIILTNEVQRLIDSGYHERVVPGSTMNPED